MGSVANSAAGSDKWADEDIGPYKQPFGSPVGATLCGHPPKPPHRPPGMPAPTAKIGDTARHTKARAGARALQGGHICVYRPTAPKNAPLK